jgi:hypothetical protein
MFSLRSLNIVPAVPHATFAATCAREPPPRSATSAQNAMARWGQNSKNPNRCPGKLPSHLLFICTFRFVITGRLCPIIKPGAALRSGRRPEHDCMLLLIGHTRSNPCLEPLVVLMRGRRRWVIAP